MNALKRTTILLLILICSSQAFSQQDIIAGIWKYKNNNEVFIVDIWKVEDEYRGHYKKIVVDSSGNQITIVYNSNTPIGTSSLNWPYVILSSTTLNSQYAMVGMVIDNTIPATQYGGLKDGSVTIQVLNPTCYSPSRNTCPLQAQWTVKKMAGFIDPNEPPFNIPTNIILTKD